MPEADLEAMLELAKSIRAHERIQAVQDGLAASGWTKKGAVSKHLRALGRQARSASPDPMGKRPTPSQAAIDISLHRAGIQVVKAGGNG